MRADVYTAYQTLLIKLEAGGAQGWGVMTVRQVIARMMPQTYDETGLYYYGLRYPNSPQGVTLGSFDLMPGMILRVVSNDYLAVNNSSVEYLNGYLNTANADYEIGSYYQGNNWLLGFDSFISALVSKGALTVDTPTIDTTSAATVRESPGADAADLYFSGFTQPFYRVFVPTKLSNATAQGTTVTTANFMIAAAINYTALSTMNNVVSTTNMLAYFRGRVVLKAFIRIYVNGIEKVVPVGTSLQNILESLGRDVPYTTTALQGISLQRSLGNAVLDTTVPFNAGASYNVRVDWQQLEQYSPGYTGLAVPLVHGDIITI
jgi:hypothetical protein